MFPFPVSLPPVPPSPLDCSCFCFCVSCPSHPCRCGCGGVAFSVCLLLLFWNLCRAVNEPRNPVGGVDPPPPWWLAGVHQAFSHNPAPPPKVPCIYAAPVWCALCGVQAFEFVDFFGGWSVIREYCRGLAVKVHPLGPTPSPLSQGGGCSYAGSIIFIFRSCMQTSRHFMPSFWCDIFIIFSLMK